ncbi:LADA_0G13080g1_1 [Lachancea dasiensis]|uniref:LADA_0G13080g1_1 n=1 Tax=Lachancea dasiensis TaxID=1072105 RepID=A0A1G4JVX0_9SACH|nr:LADA_0G13080g1_1 [Lachancea dasiensis]
MPIVHHEDQEFNLSHEQEHMLNEFQVISNFPDAELAQVVRLLENNSWQLEPALCRYFDGNWQENLEQPPAVAPRPPTPMESEQIAHTANPFEMGDHTAFVPKLPIVKRLPLDFKDKFQYAGLDRRTNEFATHPGLFVLLLIPKLLLRIGTGLLTLLWSIISFGFTNSQPRTEFTVQRVPRYPEDNPRPFSETLAALVGPQSDLQSLLSPDRFNTIYEECERQFKPMLVVCLGDLESEELDKRDQNSSRFVKNILNDPSTLQLLREQAGNVMIYMNSATSPEMWALAKQLKLSHTPTCLLVANVLNSKGSMNGVTRMSVIGKLKVSSLRSFQNSFKVTLERHSAELVVSRNEQEELRMAREIKELQDHAYLESLRQDQIKEQKRQDEEKRTKLQQEAELSKAQEIKRRRTLGILSTLKFGLKMVENKRRGDLTTLQIRTASGKRLVTKFNGDESLQDIYQTVKCFLILNLKTLESTEVADSIKEMLLKLAQDGDVLAWKDKQWSHDSFAGETADSLRDLINKELSDGTESSDDAWLDIDFELISPFPRFKLDCVKDICIKEVPQICPNGNLLVEMLNEDIDEETVDSN